MPSCSSVVQGFWRMGDSDCETLVKLPRNMHYTAFNGLAFTGFKDETELSKPHNITFKLSAYEN